MRIVIEVGGWEHECCGPSFERSSTVEITCRRLVDPGEPVPRYVATRHEVTTSPDVMVCRGRVADIAIVHPGGAAEPLHRLPSGRALRGFDDDDGHLEQPWNGQPVTKDSDQFLVTLVS